MFLNGYIAIFPFTRTVTPLQAGLHAFAGALLRCNSLEWNDPRCYALPYTRKTAHSGLSN